MLTTLIICATVIISVYLLAHTHVHISITRNGEPYFSTTPTVTEDDVEKVYEELDKDPVPTFTDVINVINREFGGVDYEE